MYLAGIKNLISFPGHQSEIPLVHFRNQTHKKFPSGEMTDTSTNESDSARPTVKLFLLFRTKRALTGAARVDSHSQT